MTGRVLDLFAGPGGWSEGLRFLGLRDIGIEIDPAACATRAAAGHTTIRADVAVYPTAPFRSKVSGLVGSAPCQPFSAAGLRTGVDDMALCHQGLDDLARGRDTRVSLRDACSDPRSLLVVEPLRYALDLRPDWIALEEVPAVLPLFEHTARILRSLGYSVWTGVLNAANYGVPQTRRRAVLLASLHHPAAPPEPTHAKNPGPETLFGPALAPWVTMADALGLEPGLEVNTRGARRTSGGNHFSCDGPSWSLTEKARSWWVLRHSKRSNATVRRLDQPAATLVAGHARHDYQWIKVDGSADLVKRPLLLAEAAVLQSFRPCHPFHGSESRRFLQIGNAVPPLFAAAVLRPLVRVQVEVAA
ncbi:DNA cytosine methyltransferase [Streptomyces achromogenes]|uniref:DNA cytosine methyltransferase n=1 Tax=Streptomyces achromogenes TaxID=67255 RepID=UPI0036B0413C